MGKQHSFTDAAERVLRDLSSGRPMHYVDIVKHALDRGYLSTEGKTPERTLNAMIGAEYKRRLARGEEPRFVAHGNGYYGLAAPSKGIERDVERYNEATRKRLREALHEVRPEEFEYIIARLLSEIGYEEIEVTSYGRDGGIDVRATLTIGGVTRVKTAVQVKRHRRSIGSPIVREMRGSLGAHHRGLIITTSEFTPDAYEEANQMDRVPISLVDGDRLVDLLVENGIGITRKQIQLLALDRETLEGEAQPPETAPGFNEAKMRLPPYREPKERGAEGKIASIWPLPGGASKYVETTFRMLDVIAAQNPTHEEMAQWLLSNFKGMRSKGAVSGYIQVLRGLGLATYDGELLVLTADGVQLASSHSVEGLRRIFEERLLGVAEIYEFLSEGPKTGHQVHEHLTATLSLTWSTTAQTDWRLGWLVCLGALEESGKGFRIVLPRLLL